MLKSENNELSIILVVMIIGAIVGGAYTFVAYFAQGNGEGSIWSGVIIGALIMGLSSAFELFFVSPPESGIRSWPVLPALLARVMVHMGIIILTIMAVQTFFHLQFATPLFFLEKGISDTLMDVVFSFAIVSVIGFQFQMRNFIGGRTLKNLLVGRYSKPQIEERIFMVVDTVGSTAAAQKIGDRTFHAFLNRLFILFDQPIHKYGGEVHSYVGDAIIIVWPVKPQKNKNARIFEAMIAMHRICEQKQEEMLARYGIAPNIHIAAHVGPVAVGETGYRKRQITYLGNALNLTFRLESLAKQTNMPSRFVISDELLGKCLLPEKLDVVSLGAKKLKGSKTPLDVSAILVNS